MSQNLIDRSPDLKRLQNEGYALEIRSGHAIVSDIPYVNSKKEVKRGALVSTLKLIGDVTAAPKGSNNEHVMHFVGEHPCNADGSVISSIVHQSTKQNLGDGITIDHSFSNKPKNGYNDYYEKFTNYINIIKAPVHVFDSSASPQVFKPIPSTDESVFRYTDSNTSRANIGAITAKISGIKIGIVGLGGTGSYVLDFIAKTSVAEIHLFDGDVFYQHNAFRAPGAPSIDDLRRQDLKVKYLSDIYSKMHKHIFEHPVLIGRTGLDCLLELDFVFLCIDSGPDKKVIIDALVDRGIPFIDTGIGVEVADTSLFGNTRITYVALGSGDGWEKRISYVDTHGDLYASNVQIAELNSLCASLAIIRWKKHYGIYIDQNPSNYVYYDIGMSDIV